MTDRLCQGHRSQNLIWWHVLSPLYYLKGFRSVGCGSLADSVTNTCQPGLLLRLQQHCTRHVEIQCGQTVFTICSGLLYIM